MLAGAEKKTRQKEKKRTSDSQPFPSSAHALLLRASVNGNRCALVRCKRLLDDRCDHAHTPSQLLCENLCLALRFGDDVWRAMALGLGGPLCTFLRCSENLFLRFRAHLSGSSAHASCVSECVWSGLNRQRRKEGKGVDVAYR